MTTNALTSSFTTAPCHHVCSSRLAFSCRFSSNTAKFCSRRCCRGRIPLFSRRVLRVFCQGKYPTRDPKQPAFLVSMLDCLWARFAAAILWPMHVLAETIVYSKIRSTIGYLRLASVETIGVKIQVGFGMTETSPVAACQRPSRNVLGSSGHPIRYTELKIVDPDTNETIPPGTKGIIKVRGSQVIKDPL